MQVTLVTTSPSSTTGILQTSLPLCLPLLDYHCIYTDFAAAELAAAACAAAMLADDGQLDVHGDDTLHGAAAAASAANDAASTGCSANAISEGSATAGCAAVELGTGTSAGFAAE